MLTYLIMTTEALITTAIMAGLMLAYSKKNFGKIGKIFMTVGVIGGLLASVQMSYLKNTTRKIDTGLWNFKIFRVAIIALVVFLIFSIRFLNKLTKKVGEVVTWCSLTVIIFTAIFYALPDVWAYPFKFLTGDQSVMSTDFLYKLIGYLAGILLVIVTCIAMYQGGIRLGDLSLSLILKVILIINALRQASVCLQIMILRRMIESNHDLFMIAKETSNRSHYFRNGIMIVSVLVPIVLAIMSFVQKEPYSNPAERRKIKAKWRNARRWSVCFVITILLSHFTLTTVKTYNSREASLSPVEDAVMEDGNIYVSFDQVADGHLHRFAYVTEKGTQIRFIVIKKPNASSYGVGLDACDICGETGYYEKGGQVVCKLCDVVMNINTIGFKGGCNPIVIPYSVSNGNIIVPIEGLLEHESEFK